MVTEPFFICYGDMDHMLLTRQSVHVDSLGGQANAHVPKNTGRKNT